MYMTPTFALSLLYTGLSFYPHIYYKNANSTMQMFGVTGPIHIKRGVKDRAIFSLKVLTSALDKINDRLQWRQRGLVSAKASWDYSKQGADWSKIYPECGGQRQSPINFVEKKILYHVYPRLKFEKYSRIHPRINFINNGHTVDVTGPWGKTGKDIPIMSGGPLQGKYQLAGVHFHWGHNHLQGSEHTINGLPGVLEMHFVHFNTKYRDVSDAIKSKDPEGLAVVGILFELSHFTTRQARPIFRALKQVAACKYNILFPIYFPLDLISYGGSYFTYQGSLTTPPCSESVRWIVMERPLDISLKDLDIFKRFTKNGVPMMGIYRETQPLHERKVHKSLT